jgi:glyoxylase-like metal-dependent hydrolase (beta-lactamase superfamily II)
VFEVADVTLEVMHTPGHSAGSVCLYCEELGAVFCGDLLAADGLVTSEDGFSNFARQLSSIGENLLTLAPETRVLPGHGPEFTVAAAEKNFDSWVSAGPDAGLAADLDEDGEDED